MRLIQWFRYLVAQRRERAQGREWHHWHAQTIDYRSDTLGGRARGFKFLVEINGAAAFHCLSGPEPGIKWKDDIDQYLWPKTPFAQSSVILIEQVSQIDYDNHVQLSQMRVDSAFGRDLVIFCTNDPHAATWIALKYA